MSLSDRKLNLMVCRGALETLRPFEKALVIATVEELKALAKEQPGFAIALMLATMEHLDESDEAM